MLLIFKAVGNKIFIIWCEIKTTLTLYLPSVGGMTGMLHLKDLGELSVVYVLL